MLPCFSFHFTPRKSPKIAENRPKSPFFGGNRSWRRTFNYGEFAVFFGVEFGVEIGRNEPCIIMQFSCTNIHFLPR
nr:MAG TPA: hypothetical protein [Caudoviricetes sp.]